MTLTRFVVAAVAAVLVILPSAAQAQFMGAFHWQLQPYCNVVTLNVTAQGGIFTLDGFDDQCGAGQRASVVGTAFPNPDGTIGIGLNTVLAPGGAFVHLEARISLASLGGPWRDSAGNSGTFAFTPGADAGGPQRPIAGNGIAASSITAAQLAPGTVAEHINPAQVQTRVTGTCAVGQYLRGINENGSVICEPVPITVHGDASSNLIGTFSGVEQLLTLSANGTGALVIPFPARLRVQGIVRLFRNALAENLGACVLQTSSGVQIAGTLVRLAQDAHNTVSVIGAIDVAPGTYDVQLECSAIGSQWYQPQITAFAVPR